MHMNNLLCPAALSLLATVTLGLAPATQPAHSQADHVRTETVASQATTQATTQASTPATRPAERAAERPNLERSMKAMDRALNAIARAIEDPTKDAQTLLQIDALQRATAEGKGAPPHEIDELSGEEKAKELAAYRTLMLNMLKAAIVLEEAVMKGDRAAAKAAIDEIQNQRKSGHSEYGVKKHDELKK